LSNQRKLRFETTNRRAEAMNRFRGDVVDTDG
jgi:hypothetical protein